MTKKEMLDIQNKKASQQTNKNQKLASRSHKVGTQQVFIIFNIALEISRCTLHIKLFIFITVKRTVKHNLQKKAKKEIDSRKGSTSKVLLKLVKTIGSLVQQKETDLIDYRDEIWTQQYPFPRCEISISIGILLPIINEEVHYITLHHLPRCKNFPDAFPSEASYVITRLRYH